ncbi:amino acid permease [Propionicicella superfundia]|uniref:amino acid permease n=1 Tax=Propionicicella superfundia TaxID=348582 RepID=UPI0003F68B06|nr:amino acid permease [Propionicicella superfundia]
MSIDAEDKTLAVSGVTYQKADAAYFDKRRLQRTAGFWGLWGIGVAAVISGNFSGWNGGIATAGWGGFLVATIVVVIMYVMMIESISEMASAMPHTGGAYSFARAAMGPWGGFVTGLAETIEYVMTTGVVVFYSSQYADEIVRQLSGFSLIEQGLGWVWWVVLYAVFVLLNASGANASFTFAVVVSIISVGILVLYAVLALATGTVDFGALWDIAPAAGGSVFLPFGIGAVFFAMPFAMWLFLGIEELPLAAEEAHNPERDIPRAGRAGMLTLVVTGAIVLFLNPAVLGAEATGSSLEPLLDAFRAIIPGNVAAILSTFALIGLLASIQGIMFGYGRNMYSLSRAGYYPKFLSLTGKRQTPYVALVVGAVIGFAALFIVQYGGEAAGGVVLNIAVWGAVLAYLLQMVSYVILRLRHPEASRPHRSPFGLVGAVIAGVIALAIFVAVLLNPAYTPAIVTIIVVYILALVLFAVLGRNKLVLSPEEEYAVLGGLSDESVEP